MFIDDINRFSIILASRSPRRRQLLDELGLKFRVVLRDWKEVYPPELKGKDVALHIARKKSDLFKSDIKENEIVITADTIVWCNDKVLHKPVDHDDALKIIGEISGNTHEVITGVCLLSPQKQTSFYSSTRVTFEKMSAEEIEYYIREYNPYDKAGAYGIQEWIGLSACSYIEGSYFNVMGLPVHQVYSELRKFISG